MNAIPAQLEQVARDTRFNGVVRVDVRGSVPIACAFGLANRAARIPVTAETRFGMASGSKAFTALVVVALVQDDVLTMDTPARSLLGSDLPLISDEVTIEQLLAHRSGIGDYLDEDGALDVTDYLVGPVHELDSTEAFLKVLDGHPPKFVPDESFSYCNSGYVVLALIAERASGMSYSELVRERVTRPAGMSRTGFLRSDELPGDAALGYFDTDGLRTNVFHLPVLGSGDGGAYSTAEDVCKFWTSLFAGRIVALDRVEEMVRPRSDVPREKKCYGLGFWLDETDRTVMLEGYDAGVSFWTAHDRERELTCTVMSNTTDGAWQIARVLREQMSEPR